MAGDRTDRRMDRTDRRIDRQTADGRHFTCQQAPSGSCVKDSPVQVDVQLPLVQATGQDRTGQDSSTLAAWDIAH